MTPGATSIACARTFSWIWRFRSLQRAQRLFGRCRPGAFLIRPYAGYKIALDPSRSDAHRLVLLDGERYVEERHVLRRLVSPGSHVVEVGANVGYVTLLLVERTGPNGLVTCLEPDETNFAELERNIEINALRNVKLHDCAAGARSGRTSFTPGLNGRVGTASADSVEIEVRRLDDLVLEPVDFIKIDVEGHEQAVLEGTAAILRHSRPRLFVEVHPQILGSAATRSVLELLLAYDPGGALFVPRNQARLFTKLACRYLGLDGLQRLFLRDLVEADHSRHAAVWVTCAPR